jgi:hypothetical protein
VNVLKAAGLVGAAAVVFVQAALAADRDWMLSLYSQRFSFLPGPWFGEHLLAAKDDQADVCLIIGSSTAREGLDVRLLEAANPGTRFVNAATGGHSVATQEVQANVLDRYRMSFKCILFPVHPWLLYETEDSLPRLVGEEYLSLLRLADFWNLSFIDPLDLENRDAYQAFLVPIKKYSWQMNRIIRDRLRKAHLRVFEDDIPLARYELYKGELTPSGDSLYTDRPIDLVAETARVRQLGLMDRSIYGGEATRTSFRRAVDILRRRADLLVVVRMPDTDLLRDANQWATPAFDSLLAEYSDRIVFTDCSSGFSTTHDFVDLAHLNSAGRRALSTSVAGAMQRILANDKTSGTVHCR